MQYPFMKWDLSLFTAEIVGRTLTLDLKAKPSEIERHFKYDTGEYFKCRQLLINFGYNEFKKALRLGTIQLDEFRVDTFYNFFNAIQKVESGASLAGGPCPSCGTHNDFGITYCVSCGSSMDAVPGGKGDEGPGIDTSFPESACPKCGFEKPEGARFCPGCGARLE
ncbi:MAG: zinc ribbon domain-containing protein [Candidatus Sigynarchaeota archaeon]